MNHRNIIIAGLLCMAGTLSAQKTVFMKDLDVSKIWQEYGSAFVQDSVIELHAKSEMKLNLDGKAERFCARMGINTEVVDIDASDVLVQPLVDGTKLLFRKKVDGKQLVGFVGADGKLANGSVRFVLKGDGKTLYDSGVLGGKEGWQDIDVSLEGVRRLEITIDPTSDGPSGDRLTLLSPRFDYKGSIPEMLNASSMSDGPIQTDATVEKLQKKVNQLPVWESLLSDKTSFDWLLTPEKSKAGIYRSADGKNIIVANEMVYRTFRVTPNLATVDFTNRMLGESMLRAVSSEGAIWIDGKKWHIGGLAGQPERGYLKEDWIDEMVTIPESFLVEDFEIKPVDETIKWARSRWALNKEAATGQEIIFTLRGDKELKDVTLKVHFAVYDRIPVIRKWMEVENNSAKPVNIDCFKLEKLAFAEPESPSGGDPATFLLPNI